MRIKSVDIRTIQPSGARYRTAGDWYHTALGVLRIDVVDSGDWRYNMLVAFHELAEALICIHTGVSEQSVTRFDLAHIEDDDPGSHPKAPYHAAHILAMALEMALSVALGVKWRTYEAALDKASSKVPASRKP